MIVEKIYISFRVEQVISIVINRITKNDATHNHLHLRCKVAHTEDEFVVRFDYRVLNTQIILAQFVANLSQQLHFTILMCPFLQINSVVRIDLPNLLAR